MKDKSTQIIIIDLGSQYTKVIRRSLRILGYYSVIIKPEESLDILKDKKIKGIILSGGSASVYDVSAPIIPKQILEYDIPILGICFGMQWLAYIHDSNSIQNISSAKSYGKVEIDLSEKYKSKLFDGLEQKLTVWASHGDSVKYAPEGFVITATSHNGATNEAMECADKKLWAVQFHPEVDMTEDQNIILSNFVAKICLCKKDYIKTDLIEEIKQNTKKELGDGVAIIGVSGGVDSTVLAAILSPYLGEKLKAFFIDTGGMRKGEVEKIKEIAKKANINLEIIEKYKNRFIKQISTTIDAEEKRAHFREVYGEVFNEVALNYNATHMIQGTLATDLIESGIGGGSDLIKTHHNVGLNLGLKELIPFKDLFKFEVRGFATDLGLDELISKRQPFPGPGLYLRIVGVPVTLELLDLVRESDDIVEEILKKYNIYDKIAQTVVALFGIKTVGVKGDSRVYGYSLVVRTVETVDFMTVKGFYLSKEVCEEISNTLLKNALIVRVLFDFTSKPPATVEFE